MARNTRRQSHMPRPPDLLRKGGSHVNRKRKALLDRRRPIEN
jgi:hypothetical protein